MAGERQRFCPVCDHAFAGGEAVLRCGVCGLLHHPACWVRNRGCNAGCVGADQPQPMAYEINGPPVFPHPAEGTRVASQRTPGLPLPGAISRPDPVERVTPVSHDQPVIGGATGIPPMSPPPVPGRPRPPAGSPRAEIEPHVIDPPPRALRGRMPGGSGRPPVDDLRLYRRHEFLRYWYVPVAALLAVAVAVGVIWGTDQLIGGGGDEAATPQSTATPAPAASTTATPPGVATTTPAVTGTPPAPTRPTGTTTPAAGGGRAVVSGTGGECLNIRTGPGTANPAVDCLAEGTVVTLAGEKQESGGITWVRIQTENGHDGWVSDQYVRPQ